MARAVLWGKKLKKRPVYGKHKRDVTADQAGKKKRKKHKGVMSKREKT